MPKLVIIPFWLIFFIALSLAVSHDIIPDRAENIMIILAASTLVSILVYAIYKVAGKYIQKDSRWRWLRYAGYVLAVVLGAMLFFFQYFANIIQMAFSIILGILAISVSIIIYEETHRYREKPFLSVEDWIFRGIWSVFVIVVIGAYISGKLTDPILVVSIVMFGTLTLYFTLFTAALLFAGHEFSVKSNWGGLGAGMGGWRLSRPMVFMILAIFFGLSTSVILSHTAISISNTMQLQPPSVQTPEPKKGD